MEFSGSKVTRTIDPVAVAVPEAKAMKIWPVGLEGRVRPVGTIEQKRTKWGSKPEP